MPSDQDHSALLQALLRIPASTTSLLAERFKFFRTFFDRNIRYLFEHTFFVKCASFHEAFVRLWQY